MFDIKMTNVLNLLSNANHKNHRHDEESSSPSLS